MVKEASFQNSFVVLGSSTITHFMHLMLAGISILKDKLGRHYIVGE
jgi:hypothetical protein